MGNSLLDFVMALVRDPQAAARYAADPAGVLADAHLPGVTIADVQNLIPVVVDSLAMATPGFGAHADAASVWTSGAAAAAVDAFGVPHPAPTVHAGPQVGGVEVSAASGIDDMAVAAPAGEPLPAEPVPAAPIVDETSAVPWAADDGWPSALESHAPDRHPGDQAGFDVF